MMPQVATFQDMLGIMAIGNAHMEAFTCSTKIKEETRECVQSCSYDNGYSFAAYWSLDGKPNPDYNRLVTSGGTGGNNTTSPVKSHAIRINRSILIFFSIGVIIGYLA
jgi:hypothetical protein